MAAEIWEPVVDYESAYEVSSRARVRSIDRYVQRGDHTFHVRECILRPMIQRRSGLAIVGLAKHGRRRRFYVHALQRAAGLPVTCGPDERR